MQLKELLRRARGVSQDHREVEEGYVFFAIRGKRFDGHDFIKEVLRKNPLWVVVERDIKGEKIVRVDNTRKAFALACKEFYSPRLKVVGITGTNGKSTSTFIIYRALKEEGIRVGLVGTLGYFFDGKKLGEGRTTPDSKTWYSTLKTMEEEGAKFVVAEISSHALDQYRIYGTKFLGVGFTNLSQDHLDYHKTMENYFKSKLRLFKEYEYDFAFVFPNLYGRRILDHVKNGKVYGVEVLDFKTSFLGSFIRLRHRGKTYSFKTSLVGDFQRENLGLSLSILLEMGVSPKSIQRALEDLHVPGRFEVIDFKDFKVIIDYAHTPDALSKLLRTVRRLCPGRVISVFGAGGERDRKKRPLMGKVAERFSDLIVVTSDNPRGEEPQKICEDILRGIGDKGKVLVELNRKEAIHLALKVARSGDCVVVAGKGHEKYQEIGGRRIPFSDKEVVLSLKGIYLKV